MIKKFLYGIMFLLFSSSALAIPIGGIEFPDGLSSFADSVYSYSPGANVGPGWNDPTAALGAPDYPPTGNAVSIGVGGHLILEFVDNSLTTSGDATPDLHIFEVGSAIEWMNVAISTDALTWIDLGNVLGQPSSIDIDAVAGVVTGALYSFVRISDIAPNQSGYPFGEADIDAVGAISTVVHDVPVPASIVLFLVGLAGINLGRHRVNK